MQNYLIHNIIYKFHRVCFYIYSVIYYYHDHYRNENKIKCLFKSIFKQLKIFNYRYGYYEYLEIPITTRCSLKCIGCSNLIPCYQHPKDLDETILISSINNFLDCIEQIVYIRVLGGEPFLSKNLYSVLRVLLKSSKIQRIEIVTNGTVIPRDRRVIRKLRDSRVVVCISEYPIVRYEKLVNFLKENSIQYRVDKMKFWMNYGNVDARGKTNKELKKQFLSCHSVCKSLLNGQFHLCPRSSHGTDLGIIKDNKDDYVDLLDNTLDIYDRRKKINQLLKKKYIKACDYCDYGTKKCRKIPVASQLKIQSK